MADRRGVNPEALQEPLLVVAESTNQVQPRRFEYREAAEGASVHRIEQKLELINSLSFLAVAKSREGLVTVGPEGVSDLYGEEASAVVLGAEKNRQTFILKSKIAFARASGHYALLDAGFPTLEVKATTRQLYSDFLKTFSLSPEHHTRSFNFRKQLAAEARHLSGDPEVDVSVFNRRHGWRPHSRKPQPRADIRPPEDGMEPQLDTPQRLEAIYHDARASFFPKTNASKNRVLSWLDYLDNPNYPLGIVNQLREVVRHNQRPDKEKQIRRGAQWGLRPFESIIWEVGDDLLDASRQLSNARQMKQDIDNCPAPHVTLADELGLDHTGLAAWARFRALRELALTGGVQGLNGADPLKTSEDRTRPKEFGDNAPGKHKTILNQFTRPDREKVYDDYIKNLALTVKIGEVREEIKEVIEDLENERAFMLRRLNEIDSHYAEKGETKRFRPAVRAILEELSRIESLSEVA